MGVYKIGAGDVESIQLIPANLTREIIQNIAIILYTRKGSVVIDRAFGLPRRFQDLPVNVAKPIVVAEIADAIETFEPRAKLISVDVSYSNDGVLYPTVEVDIPDDY